MHTENPRSEMPSRYLNVICVNNSTELKIPTKDVYARATNHKLLVSVFDMLVIVILLGILKASFIVRDIQSSNLWLTTAGNLKTTKKHFVFRADDVCKYC